MNFLIRQFSNNHQRFLSGITNYLFFINKNNKVEKIAIGQFLHENKGGE